MKKVGVIALKTFTVVTMLVAILLAGVVFSRALNPDTTPVSDPAPVVSKYEDGPPDAQEILELVNEERTKVGVTPLTIDEKLVQSAQWKADDMANNDYYGHPAKGQTEGANGLDYLKSLNPNCSYMSENINLSSVYSATNSLDVFKSWKGSESHYNAMISPDYSTTGVAMSNSLGKGYQVQHFCKVQGESAKNTSARGVDPKAQAEIDEYLRQADEAEREADKIRAQMAEDQKRINEREIQSAKEKAERERQQQKLQEEQYQRAKENNYMDRLSACYQSMRARGLSDEAESFCRRTVQY